MKVIPVLNLDNETYDDIVEAAVKKISQIAPEWTNYNLSDPGITLIDLFAFMKEMQQYHLNQVSIQNKMKFLKLLGMSPSHIHPSQGYVIAESLEEEILLPKCCKMAAGELVFETDCNRKLLDAMLIGGYMESPKGCRELEKFNSLPFGGMKFYAFGIHPQSGNKLYLLFDKAFPVQESISLYFGMIEAYETKRNPMIDCDSFIPLAHILWEVYCDHEWKTLEVQQDTTHCFLYSGEIQFYIQDQMTLLQGKQDGFAIRATLVEHAYDVSPVIDQVLVNHIKVYQKNTVADYEDLNVTYSESNEYPSILLTHALAVQGEIQLLLKRSDGKYEEIQDFEIIERTALLCRIQLKSDINEQEYAIIRALYYENDFEEKRILGHGNGFACQRFPINHSNILYESLEIMVEDMETGYFTFYTKVEDFEQSNAYDDHFVFDEMKEEILFGDCDYGKAPRGPIYITRLVDSMGEKGNVKSKQINQMIDTRIPCTPNNLKNTQYGENMESVEACFLRFRREFSDISRAVTDEDYEILVRNCQGLMIQACEVIPVQNRKPQDGYIYENMVTIVVEPYSNMEEHPHLSDAYYQNIYQMLLKRKLLGTKIELLSSQYIGINIFLEAAVYPHYRNAKETIHQVVQDYIEKGERTFGRILSYSDLYGLIDILQCVCEIHSLVLDASGSRRNVHGNIMLPINGVAYIKEVSYTLLEKH